MCTLSITSYVARHAYREANNATDWITAYMADHSDIVLLDASSALCGWFQDIVVTNARGYMYCRAL